MWRREESVRDAFQDLAEAETLNKASDIRRGADSTNPKIEAVIRLNYCHGYMLKEYPATQAGREMQAWKLLEKQVEHVYVRQLVGRRDAEIDKLDSDFTILGPLSEANSDQLEKALKGFLARQIDRTCAGWTDRDRQTGYRFMGTHLRLGGLIGTYWSRFYGLPVKVASLPPPRSSCIGTEQRMWGAEDTSVA